MSINLSQCLVLVNCCDLCWAADCSLQTPWPNLCDLSLALLGCFGGFMDGKACRNSRIILHGVSFYLLFQFARNNRSPSLSLMSMMKSRSSRIFLVPSWPLFHPMPVPGHLCISSWLMTLMLEAKCATLWNQVWANFDDCCRPCHNGVMVDVES